MPSRRLITFVILLLSVGLAKAQEKFVILNIGFKFGYAVSDQSSLVGGIEVSLNYYRDGKGVGILVSTEQLSGREMDHYAVQGFLGLVGMSFGPSVMRTKDDTTSGYSCTLFGGAIALPYYRFTTLQNGVSAHEFGFFAKLPLSFIYPKFSGS